MRCGGERRRKKGGDEEEARNKGRVKSRGELGKRKCSESKSICEGKKAKTCIQFKIAFNWVKPRRRRMRGTGIDLRFKSEVNARKSTSSSDIDSR